MRVSLVRVFVVSWAISNYEWRGDNMSFYDIHYHYPYRTRQRRGRPFKRLLLLAG